MNCQLYCVCCIFLSGCAYFDIRYRKIPNRLVICAACAGAAVSGVDFIARFVLAMSVSYMISHLRVIGGGDLKMFSVIMGLTGFRSLMIIVLIGSICCITVRGALILAKRKNLRDTFPMAPYVLAGYVCWRCVCVAS